MITEINKPRQAGPAFYAYIQSRKSVICGENSPKRGDTAILRERTDARENGNSSPDSFPQSGRITGGNPATGKLPEDWEIERLDGEVRPTHVTSSMSSYMRQNAKSEIKKPVNRSAAPKKAHEIAAKFCENATHESGRERVTEINAGAATSHEKQEVYINPNPNPRYPHAAYQNPTKNPEVAMMLEKYGDMRGVFTKHPAFVQILKPESDGGWGVELAGLISMGKKHTLERVLWALRQAKQYQGSRCRGAIFNYAVRNGLEVR